MRSNLLEAARAALDYGVGQNAGANFARALKTLKTAVEALLLEERGWYCKRRLR